MNDPDSLIRAMRKDIEMPLREQRFSMCWKFGTGLCCQDKCFSLEAVPPEALKAVRLPPYATALCGREGPEKLTTVREDVSCKRCLERLGS